jgi:hypothetical protein
MCLLLSLIFLGPRAAIIVYWLGWPARWEAAFDTFIVPFIGFLVLPYATLCYVLVAPGGVKGFDYVLLALGVVLDVVSLGGSFGLRQRSQVSASSSI